jgi:hypothetical protein
LRQYLNHHPIHHPFHLIESTLPLLKLSAHNWERRRFESNSYLARGVFLTLTETRMVRAAQVTFGIIQEITGLTNVASSRATLCQVIGTLTPLGLMPMSPSTSLLPLECALDPPILGLNCITRLRGRNGLSGN